MQGKLLLFTLVWKQDGYGTVHEASQPPPPVQCCVVAMLGRLDMHCGHVSYGVGSPAATVACLVALPLRLGEWTLVVAELG